MQNEEYREILKRHLSERMELNPRYSLRAFSRDLGISPSRMSEILNGKQGLSEKWARKVAERLSMSSREADLFCQKVLASNGRAKATRQLAKKQIENQKAKSHFETLDYDVFKVLSDWYHFAILELTKLKTFRSNPSWMARELGV